MNHRKDLNAQSIDHAEPVCFASHSSFGVVDLGASKTVIGSKGVQELLEALHPEVKAKCYRTPCVINFRFGNQGMLASQWALVIPLNPSLHLKVAVVPGNTPFLLSNALLRTLGAVIDTKRSELWSHEHQFQIPLTLTNRGLFLLDINQLLSHMWPSLKADHRSCLKSKLVPRDHLSDTIVGVESKSRSLQQQLPLITEPSNDETTVTCHAVDDKYHDVPSNHTGELEVTGDSMEKHKCVPKSNLDQKTNTSSSSSPSCDFGVCCHGHVVGSFEEGSNRCCREVTAGHSSPGSRGGEDSLREETPGTILQHRMVGGSSLGAVVHRPLRIEQQQQSQEVLDVCGEKGSRTGTVGDYHSQDQWRVWDRKSTTDSPKAQRCTEGQEPWSSTNDSASRRDHVPGRGVRCDRDLGDAHLSLAGSAGCCCLADTDAQPRDGHDRDHHSPEGPATSVDDYRTILMAGDHDLDFPEHLEPFCTGVTEKKKFQQLVHQYEQEYHALLKQRPCVKKESIDVLEVFCGPHSTLTTQARNLGLKASRFTLVDGDLHTADGRRELFCRVIDMDPNNMWYSPECRPWSAWSFLNGSLSRDAWARLYADRLKGLEQVALGLVLFRIQVSRHHHMHWEQLSRSLMFQLPHMQEVFAYTKMAEFDLCNVAQYHDPVSRKPIKKGLCVCTTSQKLFQLLHGRKCQRNHEHQAIEGTTMFQGQRISRSRFTEHYPRKFVRQIVKLWKQCGRSEAPFSDLILSTVLAETVEPAPKRPRIRAAPPVAPRWIEPAELPCLKRRKLDKQVDPTPSLVTEFQKVFQKIDEATPRVGKRVLQSDTEILQQMQKWFPEKKLVLGISCRGTDRLQPPPKELTPSEAPFRITVCSHRTTGKFFVTESWEEWQHLAQRQLIRSSGCPSRLSITVYARNPEISSGSSSPGVTTSDCLERVPEPDNRSTEISGGSQVETPHVKSREAVDISSEHHGPRFRALSSLERQAIVKCHKNLGHPSADRLKILMKQQSFRPEMIEAIDDFKRSLCAEMKGPHLSRPAAFREPLDFNEHISMDGIVRENKQGTSFHFYHVVENATSFHVAGIAPNRTTDQVLQFLSTQWLSWAGPPTGLTVDAATELNSDEMDNFCQGLGIKKKTISPEAHWQNSRVERHGQVLQHMLDKYQEEHPINSYHDLQVALAVCVSAKNASAVKRGFTPELLVLGKRTRLPGSICGDDSIASHALAESDLLHGAQFRAQLAKRETAFRAFWEADNSAAIRRALLRRSRPHRGTYGSGEWIMIWRQAGAPKGQWIGPMKVVTQENSQTIWCTRSGKLYRCSPEQARPVSAYEAQQISPDMMQSQNESSISEQLKEIQRQNNHQQFQDLTETSNETSNVPPQPPPTGEPIPADEAPPTGQDPITSDQSSIIEPDDEPEAPSVDAEVPTNPENVPVPDSEDDTLQCAALLCHDCDDTTSLELQEDQVWHAEILVCQEDIDQWRQSDEVQAAAFLATTAKRQRVEVKIKDLNPEEKAEMDKAKQSEVTNWLATGTVERMLRSQVSPAQVMRCRWILTWKPLDEETRQASNDPSKDRKAKARIVVLGFMDSISRQAAKGFPHYESFVQNASTPNDSLQKMGPNVF